MLPLRDLNPTLRTPYLTWGLIIVNVLVFLWQLGMPDEQLVRMIRDLSVVPADLTADPFSLESIRDVLRSMFLHGGIAHIAGNMLYLFLFGDNVEDYLGKALYLLLYFGAGIVAVIAQVAIDPDSTVPLVGASGAIAGVLGAYLVLYPNVKVEGIVPIGFFAFFAALPAWLVLGFWFLLQLINSVASIGVQTSAGGGVAFSAHVAGFVLGVVLTFILMVFLPDHPRVRRYQRLYDRTERWRL